MIPTNDINAFFRSYASNLFIRTKNNTYSFKDILMKSDEYLKHISSIERCRVGLLCVPSIETIAILFTLIRLQAEIIVLSPKEPENRIHSILNQLEADILLCTDKYLNKSQIRYAPIPVCAIEKIDTIKSLIIPKRMKRKRVSNAPSFIIMTSGSSGSPKSAVLTIDNMLVNAHFSNRNISFKEGDTWLLSLPLSHVSGLSILFRAIEGGGCIYVPENQIRWQDTELPPEITHISVVSTIMKRILDNNRLPENNTLKAMLLGGGPIPEGLVKTCYAKGFPLYVTYGLTEMASQVTTSTPEDTLEHLLTSGKPLINDTVHIEDDGTISVNGPCRFLGYLKNGILEKPFDSQGWFNTQDFGEWTSDGYLRVLGRKDLVFICGGENIQPEEIENCMLSSGYVEKAVVIPLDDAEYGMIPIAFVEFAKGYNEDKLKSYLKERISGIKIPRYFYPIPEEFNVTGIKVSRKILQNYAYKNIKVKD
ncbi:MAG TPA: o-succinylbenzoate--CoA ligase [Candidatus Hydrogenedens sp.]|nr:o-succinylbenzoate--CoA ligase [Candidatus Hydrogenedens sp.]HOL19848.1 o-succinylbenzoate--CoA ligase [Candidatus Hydrogenedens sp.]HPP59569.1 o-succinylbenzoate--CoA ligase [Candidatus Hydrogenedens sp.]